VPLVIYGILAEQNIAKLFAAAFIPGLIAAGLYCLAISLYVLFWPAHGPASERHSSAERLAMLKEVWPVAAIFALMFGGIYGGLFTPTEGAAVGAASALAAGVLKRELDRAAIVQCFLGAAETTGMIFMIFLGADLLNSALALSQMPAMLAQAVAASGLPPVAVIVAILLFYVILGAVMDELSMILLTIPIIFPAVMGLDLFGLNPASKAIWFGILVLCVVEFGLIAPPVGLNVYVVNSFARDVPMAETYKGVLPFLGADVLRVALLIAFPGLSLWLVGVLT
jgi:tripartite ATP-independent transporter DctM subunit